MAQRLQDKYTALEDPINTSLRDNAMNKNQMTIFNKNNQIVKLLQQIKESMAYFRKNKDIGPLIGMINYYYRQANRYDSKLTYPLVFIINKLRKIVMHYCDENTRGLLDPCPDLIADLVQKIAQYQHQNNTPHLPSFSKQQEINAKVAYLQLMLNCLDKLLKYKTPAQSDINILSSGEINGLNVFANNQSEIPLQFFSTSPTKAICEQFYDRFQQAKQFIANQANLNNQHPLKLLGHLD